MAPHTGGAKLWDIDLCGLKLATSSHTTWKAVYNFFFGRSTQVYRREAEHEA